jgi:hypothetical protein
VLIISRLIYILTAPLCVSKKSKSIYIGKWGISKGRRRDVFWIGSRNFDFVAPNDYGIWAEVCGKKYLFGNKIVRES